MGKTMRKAFIAASLLAFAAGGAIAQAQTPPAADGPANRPVNSSDSVNRQTGMPVKGSDSFTEGQAKSRIEAMGFTNVSDLTKDDNGVWRGHAMKAGKTVDVSLDYQGNVVPGAAMPGSTMPSHPTPGSAGR